MKYIIMCNGNNSNFETPRHLSVIKGERIVDRTIRLLKENGAKNVYISSDNKLFDSCGVPRLKHKRNYVCNYWLDAFYKVDEPVCYIFGDVYFTESAIKTIVNYETDRNVLFGTSIARNELHQNWGEPFAYIVKDYETFHKGIEEVKKLKDEGKLLREPIVWELYRYLHNLDVNVQEITEDYVDIDDGTMDVDNPKKLEEVREYFEKIKIEK